MGYFTQIYASDLPTRAVMVYMYLRDHTDKNKQCYPSVATIAKELKLSRSTVKRAVCDLLEVGMIRCEKRYRENGANSSTLYTLQ